MTSQSRRRSQRAALLRRLAGVGVLSLVAAACREASQGPQWLELRQIRPENRAGVFLNERLVLHFSRPVDATSVHAGSARVVAESGVAARGRWTIDGDRLEFVPAPVLAADRSDGGYQPGTRYWVELAGFPRLDGIQSDDGSTLPSSVRWSFETVGVGDASTGPVFEDTSPTGAAPVILRTTVIAPLEPIRLECAEPLDPATLVSEDFRLQPRRNFVVHGRTRGDEIPLVARLVRNDERQPYKNDAAVIELLPLDRRLPPGEYGLIVDPDLRLEDFGRHAVRVLNPSLRSDFLIVRVTAAAPASDLSIQRHVESFVDDHFRSSEAVAGVDGTASWSNDGRVSVRWPAAAGDGSAGEVELAGRVFAFDLHGSRVTVPSGAAAKLESAQGTLVLRSQGRFDVEGELVRESEANADRDCEFAEWVEIDRANKEPARRTSVSQALAALAARRIECTVLVAGGDLVIRGRVRSAQPLVLIAGGSIRAGGESQIRAPALYFVDAGTRSISYVESKHGDPCTAHASEFPWALDVADRNRLTRPLQFAVMSSSLPPEGRASRWFPSPQVHSHDGQGHARVWFIGEHSRTGAERLRDALVDDPAALVDCPTVRLLLHLDLFPATAPGSAWDPPWIDDVSLEFEPQHGGRER